MIVKYGGEIALQPDNGCQIADFIRTYIPLAGLRDQSESITASGNRSAGVGQTGVNQAQPNYPDEPIIRVNQLYWPTGAARWSKGYFLFHKSQIDAIKSSSSDGDTPLTLEITDGTTTISPSMYHLPPRKITSVNPDDNNLYLLPVVDERYYWQFSDSNSTGIDEDDTWASLFTYLEGELGGTITLTTAADASYFKPDYIEFSRKHENIATLIDAACHSIGHRFVYGLDNSRKSMSYTTSDTTLTSNIASYVRIAGGTLDSPPETGIATIFPTAKGGVPDGLFYDEQNAAGSITATQVIRSTALAERDENTESTITNTSDCNALATQVATDLRLHQAKQYDHSFVDLHDWTMCGFDDHVLFSVANHQEILPLAREVDTGVSLEKRSELNPTTRCVSMPANFHAAQLWNRFGETREASPVRRWDVDDSVDKEFVQGYALKWDGSSFSRSSATNKDARIEHNHGGNEIFATIDRESNKWFGIENQYPAKIVTAITAGSYSYASNEFTLGSGTVTPLKRDSGTGKLIPVTESAAEVVLTVYNTTTNEIPVPTADTDVGVVWVERNRYDGRWYVGRQEAQNEYDYIYNYYEYYDYAGDHCTYGSTFTTITGRPYRDGNYAIFPMGTVDLSDCTITPTAPAYIYLCCDGYTYDPTDPIPVPPPTEAGCECPDITDEFDAVITTDQGDYTATLTSSDGVQWDGGINVDFTDDGDTLRSGINVNVTYTCNEDPDSGTILIAPSTDLATVNTENEKACPKWTDLVIDTTGGTYTPKEDITVSLEICPCTTKSCSQCPSWDADYTLEITGESQQSEPVTANLIQVSTTEISNSITIPVQVSPASPDRSIPVEVTLTCSTIDGEPRITATADLGVGLPSTTATVGFNEDISLSLIKSELQDFADDAAWGQTVNDDILIKIKTPACGSGDADGDCVTALCDETIFNGVAKVVKINDGRGEAFVEVPFDANKCNWNTTITGFVRDEDGELQALQLLVEVWCDSGDLKWSLSSPWLDDSRQTNDWPRFLQVPTGGPGFTTQDYFDAQYGSTNAPQFNSNLGVAVYPVD